MSDEPNHVPRQYAPDCKLLASGVDGPRRMAAVHYVQETDGSVRIVYPANAATLGLFYPEESDTGMPALSLGHAQGPTSLLLLMNEEELRVIGTEMVAMADKMKADARSLLDAALAMRKGGA